MTFLFVILFVAAVIGAIRPYKFIGGAKRWHYGAAAFAAFILIGVTAPAPEKTGTSGTDAQKSATKAERSDVSASTSAPAATPTESQDSSSWIYNETKDEMRGSSRRTAEIESENSVDLQFPYGEQSGYIIVRQDPQYGFDVMFRVQSGQILCNDFSESYINVKFDNGPIRRFGCTGASDGTSEVAFIEGARTFLAALKKADRTVIEAEFYQNGRVQYVFKTKDLKWE